MNWASSSDGLSEHFFCRLGVEMIPMPKMMTIEAHFREGLLHATVFTLLRVLCVETKTLQHLTAQASLFIPSTLECLYPGYPPGAPQLQAVPAVGPCGTMHASHASTSLARATAIPLGAPTHQLY